jgi:hypothetical protein
MRPIVEPLVGKAAVECECATQRCSRENKLGVGEAVLEDDLVLRRSHKEWLGEPLSCGATAMKNYHCCLVGSGGIDNKRGFVSQKFA